MTPRLRRYSLGLLLLGAGAAAVAANTDPRGWTDGGTPAANAEAVLAPLPDAPSVELPDLVASKIKKPTLLVFYSPTCPHCVAVAPELQALSQRLGKKAVVMGVAHGRATQAQIDAFAREQGVTFPLVHDTEGEVAMAMGARGTPSALLVKPIKGEKGKFQVVDAWYPYTPGSDTLVEMRLSDDPWSAFHPGEYQGNRVCATCHVQEMDAWALSFHSLAWHTLEKKGDQTKPECTSCHVTGAGQATGWDGDPHSPLRDVGCESCHSAGGPHDGERVDAKTTCVGCHDADHSIAFSVEKGLPLIDHYKAVPMSEADWQGAMNALWSGQTPKALLAFPDGDTVGSAACATCHTAEHETWSAGPHGRAMATLAAIPVVAPPDHPADAPLPPGPHQTADCVRCHATPTRLESGPAPTELAGYRVDEGVGCESCHGPGGAHVAAGGGTDNIQGLGDSCPVCVLEAMCTSCHTPQWDKGWELDARLEASRHAHGAATPTP